jgi:baseplate J-like protein
VTKGSAREKHDYDPDQVKYRLGNSAVKEIVKTEGLLRGGKHIFLPGKDYRQTGDLLEWIATGDKPDPSTGFYVNYTFGEPSGITDINPGSVVRTIVEAISREISFLYEEIDHVHRSAFIDTAHDRALEMVVSLLGIERTPALNATGEVSFGRVNPPEQIQVPKEVHLYDGRRAYELKTGPVDKIVELNGLWRGEPLTFEQEADFTFENQSVKWLPQGRAPEENSQFVVSYSAFQKIVIPEGTMVSTSSRDPRRVRSFNTTAERVLLRQPDGSWEAVVPVKATDPGKQGNVPAGAVQLMPRPPLGVEYVVNRQDIVTGTEPERDDELRARAKKALESAGKATLASIESSIRRIEGVRSLLVQDRPDNVAGIIRVVVDGGETGLIQKAIDETRSAGIYVEFQRPKIASVDVTATVVGREGVGQSQAQAGVEERIRSYLSRLEIGNDVVFNRLTAAVLEGPEVFDVEDLTITVSREGQAPSTSTDENILMSREERVQVRNVNVSVKGKTNV